MRDGTKCRFRSPTDQSLYGFPMVSLSMWSTWLIGKAKWNAPVLEGFGTMSGKPRSSRTMSGLR